MLNSVCIFIGTLLSLRGSTVVSAAVNEPTNVSLTSFNMDLVLKWDPPEGAAAGVLYTAMLGSLRNTTECVNISSTNCSFTHLIISPYGFYTGWVKALLGDQSSGWVTSKKVILDNDTIIGPPNVTLSSVGTAIEVSIRNPKFAVSTLKAVYSFLTYNVTYWKEGKMDQARSLSREPYDRVTLADLEASTRYCVQVRINTRNPRPSMTSRPVCVSTDKKDKDPWVTVVVTFFILAGVLALGVVAIIYHSSISHFLCPRDALPSHLKEYLLAPPTSAVQAWDYSPPEEVFHQVSILKPDRAVNGGWRPLEDGGASPTTQPKATVQEEEGVQEEKEEKEEEGVQEEKEEEGVQDEEEEKEEEKVQEEKEEEEVQEEEVEEQ